MASPTTTSAAPSASAALPLPPVRYLAAGARRYGCRDLVTPATYARVRLDPLLGAAIAEAYMSAPVRDERAFTAYAAFRRETEAQYRFLTGAVASGGLGVHVTVTDDDPYADAGPMVEDLLRRRLKVFASAATGNRHPYLSDRVNDMFRAVHDAFGHAAIGRGFDRHGEESAWLKHSGMYSPLARRALTTETRGQSCALNFHYQGRRFPEQKATLLPRRFSEAGPPRRTGRSPR